MVKTAFAYVFSKATLSTTGVREIEQKKNVRHVLTNMRFLTSENEDLTSYSEKIDGRREGVKGSSIGRNLSDKQEKVDKRRKVKGYLPSLHNFGFCETIKTITKV